MFRARKEQLERQSEIQRKKEEEIQRKLEEKNKTTSTVPTTPSSWRAADKNKDDAKIFGARDKDKRGDGFGRNRDDAPPSERRPVFSRGSDDRKGGAFGAREGGERSSWSRGGGGSTSGGAFDKSFKDGGREGGRSAFDRDAPRKREIPSSNNDQVCC